MMKDRANQLRKLFPENNGRKFKIVLSGGPGVGKTSIVNQLRSLGLDVKIEIFTELFENADREGKLKKLFENGPKLLHDLVTLQHSLEIETLKIV